MMTAILIILTIHIIIVVRRVLIIILSVEINGRDKFKAIVPHGCYLDIPVNALHVPDAVLEEQTPFFRCYEGGKHSHYLCEQLERTNRAYDSQITDIVELFVSNTESSGTSCTVSKYDMVLVAGDWAELDEEKSAVFVKSGKNVYGVQSSPFYSKSQIYPIPQHKKNA